MALENQSFIAIDREQSALLTNFMYILKQIKNK